MECSGIGKLFYNKESGIYVDVVLGELFFVSLDKYELGCGWLSFIKFIDNVIEYYDVSYGMVCVEVCLKYGDSYLGYVFIDGLCDRGGLWYCINFVSLWFVYCDDMDVEGYGVFLD